MGSGKRIAMALGVSEVADLAQEIQLILKAKPPIDLREGFGLLKQGIHLLHARPKRVREAACQEVVHELGERPTPNVQPASALDGLRRGERSMPDEVTLRDLPILKCWPKDGGRFI